MTRMSDDFVCLQSINYIDAVFKDAIKIYNTRNSQDTTIIDFSFPNLDRSIKLKIEYRYIDKQTSLQCISDEIFHLNQNNKIFRFTKDFDIDWFWIYITPDSYIADNVAGGYYGLLYYPSPVSMAIDLFDKNLYIELPKIGKDLFDKWYMYYDYALLTDSVFEWHDMKFFRVFENEDFPTAIDKASNPSRE